jgi:hypothetical protein
MVLSAAIGLRWAGKRAAWDTPFYEEAARLGAAALPVLRDIIKGNDEMLASKATYLVSMISSSETADILRSAGRHNSAIVRVAAAASAGRLKALATEALK